MFAMTVMPSLVACLSLLQAPHQLLVCLQVIFITAPDTVRLQTGSAGVLKLEFLSWYQQRTSST